MKVLDHFKNQLPTIVSWKRDFHQNPELGFREYRTAGRIAELLESWGVCVSRGVGGTGVVGLLKGRYEGPMTLGFRAELDALPMAEKADVPFRSTQEDVFHGCGHDGHAAILLAAAKYLSENNDFAGAVAFIFQPAEELLRGASAMMADGLFTKAPIDEIYALHNNPGLKAGHIGVKTDAILSSADHLWIEVKGVGAHGAQPHRGLDPIVIACQLVGLIQTTVSRSLDALDAGVVTIGSIHGGTAGNVIPDQVVLSGTIRSMSSAGRALLQRRVKEICDGLAVCFDTSITCIIEPGVPPTINHKSQVAIVEAAAVRVVGKSKLVSNVTPLMASEDFAFLLQERPGAYFFIGQDGPNCHHPEYEFDDDALPIGAAMFVEIAKARLRSDSAVPRRNSSELVG